MAIAFRAAGTAGKSGTGGNVTPGLPSGTAENDILVCTIITNDNVTFPTMSGWNTIDAGSGGTGVGGTIGFAAFWKRAGASESAPTVTYSGSAAILAVIVGYSGAGTITAIDVNGTTQVNSNSNATVTGPAVTTVANNAWVLFLGGAANFPTFGSYSGTPTPTERVDESRQPSAGPSIFVADFEMTSPATTNNRTATLSAGCSRAGHLVALRPLTVASVGVSTESDSPFALGRSKIRSVGVSTEDDSSLALGRIKIRSVGLCTEEQKARPTPRFGFGALDDSFYDDQATYEAQLAGEPAYSVFMSVADIAQAKVTAWRNAFPGARMLAYVDVFSLETNPDPSSIYDDLVAALTADLWLRDGSDNFVESLGPGRGFYFFNDAMFDVFTAWLADGAIVDIMTRWDGIFHDNLDWQRPQSYWGAVIAGAGGTVKINGVTKTAAELKTLYDALSARLTEVVHAAFPTKDIMPNAAIETLERPDPNINGGMSEETVSDPDKLRGSVQGWFGPPWYGAQWVRNMAQRDVVLAMEWDDEHVLFQYSGSGSAGVKGRMFYNGLVKVLATQLSSESDVALALARVKVVAVGASSETDVALSLSRVKVRSIGVSTETDLTLALSRSGAIGLSLEIDLALALSSRKVRTMGLCVETDEALALSLNEGFVLPMGLCTESDSSLSLSPRKVRATGLCVEVDSVPVVAFMDAPPERTTIVPVESRTTVLPIESRTTEVP